MRVKTGAVILSLAFLAFSLMPHALAGGSSNHTFTDEAIREKVTGLPGDVVAGFENPRVLDSLSVKGDFVKVEINDTKPFVKTGNHSLKLTSEDEADERMGGRPTLNMVLDSTKTLSNYQAIRFWLYVSPEASEYFFGRYDVELFLGKDKIKKSWPAVKAGWYQYVWDLGDVHEIPDFDSILFRFGPLLEGYDQTELYLDEITLVPMDEVAPGSDLAQVALEDESWSRRYNAIKSLANSQNADALGVFVRACGDVSPAIRTLAVDVMSDYVVQHGQAAIDELKKGMSDPNWRVRLAVFELITQVQDELGEWAQGVFQEALFDENYYVRHFSIKHYLSQGLTKSDVADKVIPSLSSPERMRQKSAIRTLSEIGPRARHAVAPLIDILRNSDNDLLIRCWALRAVWEIDEDHLQPKDWTLALNLEPGQIHRHLLNRAMDRLEVAGAKAVPALISSLHSDNPQVIARACVVLATIGQDADTAVTELQRVTQDDRWYVASEANEALKQILPGYTNSTIVKDSSEDAATDVSVTQSGDMMTISNGLIELVFEEGDDNPGPQIIRTPGGENLVDTEWLPQILAFKYSKSPNMIERQWLQRIFGVPFPRTVVTELVSSSLESADYMIKFVGDEIAFLDWEYHYVLRKGDPGFYCYFVIKNISGKEIPKNTKLNDQAGIGRINHLFGLTWGMYDYVFLHDKLKGPAAFFDFSNEYSVEEYPDIYQSTFRMPDGRLVAKHEWHNYELFSHVSGFTNANAGFWMIFPSYDFFGGSMPRQLNTQDQGSKFLPMLEGKYYSGVTAYVTKDWEKTYGPMYFYLNDGENAEEMWVDAKRQAEQEKAKWPYSWLDLNSHHDRGSLKGEVQIASGASPEDAYVILSNPNDPIDPDQISLWMRNSGAYQYWTQVKQDGSFSIDNIHSGSYGLYVFKPGIFGELDSGQITISRDKTTDAGELVLSPQHNGQLVWQIGTPDGGAMEFKNGNNYHQWDNYIRYREDFPNDVYYIVGESDWTRDWNYIHPAAVRDEGKPITWTIDFDLDELPSSEYLLTIVCAGRSAHAKVILNGQEIGKLDVSIGGNHARTSPYGELVQKELSIAPELLKTGRNSIELTFDLSVKIEEGLTEAPAVTQHLRWTSWLVYDFIRLEKLNQ
jgi:HEAT repeat protein